MKRLQPLAPLGGPRLLPSLNAESIDKLPSALPQAAAFSAPQPAVRPTSPRSMGKEAALPMLRRGKVEREEEKDYDEDGQQRETARDTEAVGPDNLAEPRHAPAVDSPLFPTGSARHATARNSSFSPPAMPQSSVDAIASPPTPHKALPPLVTSTSHMSRSGSDNQYSTLSPASIHEDSDGGRERPERKKKLRERQRRKDSDESKEPEQPAATEPPTPAALDPPSTASSIDTSDSDDDEPVSPQHGHSSSASFAASAPILGAVPDVADGDSGLFAATLPMLAEAPAAAPLPVFPAPAEFVIPTSSSSRVLSVFVGTWNLHGKPPPPPSVLSSFLPADRRHDLLVLGTEEVDMSIERAVLMSPVGSGKRERWVRRVLEVVGEDEYEKMEEEAMVAMHIVVLIRRSLRTIVSGVEKGRVATGVGDVLGNKGGVAICLDIGSTSLLFVNSHLAAHQHAIQQRNADFWKINSRMSLRNKSIPPASSAAAPSLPSPSSSSAAAPAALLCDRFDRVVWLGDLNYRIEGSYRIVTHLIGAAMLEPLLHNDQLTQQRQRGRVFPSFHEHPIAFRPTYKVDVGRSPTVYDSSKKRRVPGWTDRVLWKDREDGAAMRCTRYDSVEDVRSSDHFPVLALFDVRVDGIQDRREESKEAEQQHEPSTAQTDKLEDSKADTKASNVRTSSRAPRDSLSAMQQSSSDEGEQHRRKGSAISMTFGEADEAEGDGDGADDRDNGQAQSIGTEKDSSVCAIM